MKKGLLFVFAVALSVSFTSCDKNVCYECEAYDDGNGTTIDASSFCEGDDDGQGGTLTETDVEFAVALHEGFGGNCKKK